MSPSSSEKRLAKASMRRLVDFYDPATRGPDAHGRTLDDILSWSDERLERQHNYIQNVFPLPEESAFEDLAPILDEETMQLFVQSRELRGNLLRALKRMLAFYGFAAEEKPGDDDDYRLAIRPRADCEAGFSHWVVPLNHNHRRISRMIRSLRLLGLEGAAGDFHDALIAVYEARGTISPTTISFWNRALKMPLRYAPDGTKVAWLGKN